MEDWGPQSKYAEIASFSIARNKACGSGVIVTVDLGQDREERLWVEGSDMTIGYSPWSVCPGAIKWMDRPQSCQSTPER